MRSVCQQQKINPNQAQKGIKSGWLPVFEKSVLYTVHNPQNPIWENEQLTFEKVEKDKRAIA